MAHPLGSGNSAESAWMDPLDIEQSPESYSSLIDWDAEDWKMEIDHPKAPESLHNVQVEVGTTIGAFTIRQQDGIKARKESAIDLASPAEQLEQFQNLPANSIVLQIDDKGIFTSTCDALSPSQALPSPHPSPPKPTRIRLSPARSHRSTHRTRVARRNRSRTPQKSTVVPRSPNAQVRHPTPYQGVQRRWRPAYAPPSDQYIAITIFTPELYANPYPDQQFTQGIAPRNPSQWSTPPSYPTQSPQSKRGRRPMYPKPADGYCLLTSKPWRVCFDVSELEGSLTSPEKTCCQSCFQVLAKISTTGHYCLECRVRNIKCYGQKPRCQNCSLKGRECVYASEILDQGYRINYGLETSMLEHSGCLHCIHIKRSLFVASGQLNVPRYESPASPNYSQCVSNTIGMRGGELVDTKLQSQESQRESEARSCREVYVKIEAISSDKMPSPAVDGGQMRQDDQRRSNFQERTRWVRSLEQTHWSKSDAPGPESFSRHQAQHPTAPKIKEEPPYEDTTEVCDLFETFGMDLDPVHDQPPHSH